MRLLHGALRGPPSSDGSREALHDDRYRAFVPQLREARQATGLAQEQVSKALRRPQSFMSRCETGEHRVDAVEFLDLCSLYERRPEWFVQHSPRGRRIGRKNRAPSGTPVVRMRT